jgi:hypothetical protein
MGLVELGHLERLSKHKLLGFGKFGLMGYIRTMMVVVG